MVVRRSCCTSNANRPPTKRRTYESTKFTAPKPTSNASIGAIACCCVMIELSITDRSISGIAAVISVVPIDTPNAAYTLRLWRARNGQSRRIQLSLTLAYSCRHATGRRPPRSRSLRSRLRPHRVAFLAADVEGVIERGERVAHHLGL